MLFILFGNNFSYMLRSFFTDVKTFFHDTWNAIYSFLAQYFTDAMIYLFIGAILTALFLIFILHVMNKK